MSPRQSEYYEDTVLANTFENQILYKMCANYPGHDDEYVTSGKIIAIGRIYAASPERIKGKTPPDGYALYKAIAEHIKNTRLDEYLHEIDFEAQIMNDGVRQCVLKTHKHLVDEIVNATAAWLKKYHGTSQHKERRHTSFASKYLHFHRPNAFPIMDSIAKTGLRCAGQSSAFKDYGHFCEKFLGYVEGQVQKGETKDWTPRSIDTVLVNRGRIHSGTKPGQTCTECKQQVKTKSKKPDTIFSADPTLSDPTQS